MIQDLKTVLGWTVTGYVDAARAFVGGVAMVVWLQVVQRRYRRPRAS